MNGIDHRKFDIKFIIMYNVHLVSPQDILFYLLPKVFLLHNCNLVIRYYMFTADFVLVGKLIIVIINCCLLWSLPCLKLCIQAMCTPINMNILFLLSTWVCECPFLDIRSVIKPNLIILALDVRILKLTLNKVFFPTFLNHKIITVCQICRLANLFFPED